MPDSAYDFVNAISQTRADLSKINFAIFGLGDQGYADTFNMGSEKLADVLRGAGATQIGERGLFDASTLDMPEDIAVPWLKDILTNMSVFAEVV
jgi:MioC protein